MAASPDLGARMAFDAQVSKIVNEQIAADKAAAAAAPSPVQLAPVIDLISTIMTPRQATAASPTGGDGGNKQAYGGDIATLRPVANAGDSGGTMLTGPVGVDPEAMLLAKKSLLGA